MMKAVHAAFAATMFALCAGAAAPAAAETINLVYSGLAVQNTRAAPDMQAFTDWCATGAQGCIPTVQQPMYDLKSGHLRGTVYVWATLPFVPGASIPSSFCFSEFMVFVLPGGELYTHTPPNGTCGATIDPALKPPQHADAGAQTVIAGGGDGVIVGGSGRFRHWSGSFTDRVFVGFGSPDSGVGGIVYYDQLIFSISGQ